MNEQGSSTTTMTPIEMEDLQMTVDSAIGELTDFSDLALGQSNNIGSFAIINTDFLPYFTYQNQKEDILHWYVEDKTGKLAVFSHYGEIANKHKIFDVGQIVTIENFRWVKSAKNHTIGNVIFNENEGSATNHTDVIVNNDLTQNIGIGKIPDYTRPFSLEQVVRHPGKFVLQLETEMAKVHRKTDKFEGFIKNVTFKTSDDASVHVTFFGENANRIFAMHSNDLCLITGATTTGKMYRGTLEFSGHDHTQIETVASDYSQEKQKKKRAKGVTLAELKNMTETQRTGKYFIISCLARSKPIMNRNGHSEFVIVDGSIIDNKLMSAVMRIIGECKIEKGQAFMACTKIIVENDTPFLVTEKESVFNNNNPFDTAKMFEKSVMRL